MSLVNFNTNFAPKAPQSIHVQKSNSNSPSIFTPAPSVETAGSVASSAPASSGSFGAVC